MLVEGQNMLVEEKDMQHQLQNRAGASPCISTT
jgi:hypothetical protein